MKEQYYVIKNNFVYDVYTHNQIDWKRNNQGDICFIRTGVVRICFCRYRALSFANAFNTLMMLKEGMFIPEKKLQKMMKKYPVLFKD